MNDKEKEKLQEEVKAIERKVREGLKVPRTFAPDEEWKTYNEVVDRRYASLSKEEKEKLQLYNLLKMRGEK